MTKLLKWNEPASDDSKVGGDVNDNEDMVGALFNYVIINSRGKPCVNHLRLSHEGNGIGQYNGGGTRGGRGVGCGGGGGEGHEGG